MIHNSQKMATLSTHPSGGGVALALPLSPAELATLLTSGRETLVLDCRSFIAYNKSHILGAHNITCPTLLLKRLQQKSRKRRPSQIGRGHCVLLEKLVNSQEVSLFSLQHLRWCWWHAGLLLLLLCFAVSLPCHKFVIYVFFRSVTNV